MCYRCDRRKQYVPSIAFPKNEGTLASAHEHQYEPLLFLQRQKKTCLQYKKTQAPRTTFSIFIDEGFLGGGHGNCCGFYTLTGMHHGAHIDHAK